MFIANGFSCLANIKFKMNRIWIIFVIELFIVPLSLLGQNPVADFSIKPQGCINELILTNNTSTNSVKYEWDLCQGDLKLTPTGSLMGTVTGSNIPTGMDVVYNGDKVFAFVTSRNNNSIVRVQMNADQTTIENITALSSIVGISSPIDIKIVSENGNWYGFVYNEGPNTISRLDFGNSLTNIPTTSVAVISTTTSTSNQGLDVISDGTLWYVVYTFNSKVGVLKLNTITSIPSVADKFITSDMSGSPALGDIKIMSDAGNFYAYCPSYGLSTLFKLSFGTQLLAAPVVDDISSFLISSINYYGVDGGYDNGVYYLLASTLQGIIIRITLGETLSQTPVKSESLGNITVFSNTVKNRLVKVKGRWNNYGVDYSNGNLFKGSFPDPSCGSNSALITQTSPTLNFTSAGKKNITLTAYNSIGQFTEKNDSVIISSLIAPDLTLSTINNCVNSNIIFSVVSNQSIVSASWDFGDGATDNSTNPSHKYATAGAYPISFSATSSNSCNNISSSSISIYNPPVAAFNLPINNPLCTNQQLTFTNTSTFDTGSNPTWEWFVNGSSVSTTKDLQQAFSSNSSQTIKLKTSILGCFNESSQVINSLLAGPQVGFTSSGKCENNAITFTNTTTDPVTGFLWDFGDSQTSSSIDASHVYTSFGTYSVVLQGTSANGCQNSARQNLTIYTNPNTDFSLSLPPFSCTGSPSQFNDLTPNPVDSNLASWLWGFDDPGSGLNSSTARNATHTYSTAGDYNVSLTAKTNFGCQATVVKKVTVSQAPQIAFSNTPACQNQGTNFSDESGNAQSWFWQIENTTYNIKNPIHVFAASGNYAVNLTVTSTNNCISFLSKAVNVPKPLTPDFSFQKNCINQNTEFVDLTDGSNDPVTTQQWTFGTLGTATGSLVMFTFPSIGAVSTTMEVTAQSGCKYSITKSVSIVNAPTALFTANPEAGVPPLDVSFSNNSSNASSYLWTFNDSNNTTSTEVSPSFTFNEIGDHVVDLTAYNNLGCSDTLSKIIKAMLPVYDISLIGFNIIKNDDGSLKLIAALHNEGNVSVNNMSLELSLSGVTSVREAVTETIIPQASANHILNYEITDASKLEFLCVTVILANDLSTDNNERCITLDKPYFLYDPYPNPASDLLNINWIADSTEPLSVIIIDALGNQVMTTSLSSEQGLNSVKMLTDGLADGIYAMFLKYGSYKEIKRISIEH
jgi:PKD repeat protein